ncbi:MAG: hypothetical protein JWQ35_856, partial [Bacteriovoracaceae bacterium]|nr:hypothetical protein [Bacteriovoracaceae bacterium]
MQISEIQIEKFKGLKKATFRINPKLQVIAGPNNAGKTTLIKAIELFFSISSSDVDTSQFAPKNPYYLKEGRRTLTKIRISFNCLSELEKQIFSSAFAPRLGAIWCECRITRQGKVTFKASKKANGEETYSAVVDRYRIVHIPVLRIGDQGFASTETKRLMATVKEILVRSRRGKDSDEQKKFTRNINKVTASILKVLEEGKKTAKNLISE